MGFTETKSYEYHTNLGAGKYIAIENGLTSDPDDAFDKGQTWDLVFFDCTCAAWGECGDVPLRRPLRGCFACSHAERPPPLS